MLRSNILPLLLGLLIASPLVLAQPSPVQAGEPSHLATGSASSTSPRTVTLNVLVSDRSGHPVTTLTQADFVLRDNGQPMPILRVQPPRGPETSSSTQPTQLILVIDAVNVGINTVDYERSQVDRFLHSNGGKLPVPVSVLIFTDTAVRLQQTPSQDGNALAADLEKQVIGLRELRRSAGFWGATERYDLSVRTLRQLLQVEATRPGHKLVVWISPGWPYLSGPAIDLSGKQEASLFQSVVDVSREFERAQVTLYSIDPLGLNDAGSLHTTYYESFLKGVRKPSDVEPADLSLQVLATHSGGRVTFGNNDITKQIANAAADAASFYVVTAQLPAPDQPNAYHDLQLKIEAPGLTGRTTTGYYTPALSNAVPR